MELGKIINARKTIEELAPTANIGANLAYWMTKFMVKTDGEQMFYATEIKKIFDKYAKVDDGAPEESAVIPQDKVNDFYKESDALAATDVEDPGIRFSLSALSAELKLSMKQMYTLLDFVDETK